MTEEQEEKNNEATKEVVETEVIEAEDVQETKVGKTVVMILLILSIVVWLLAIFWHPFGQPMFLWHLINGSVTILLFLWWLLAPESN